MERLSFFFLFKRFYRSFASWELFSPPLWKVTYNNPYGTYGYRLGSELCIREGWRFFLFSTFFGNSRFLTGSKTLWVLSLFSSWIDFFFPFRNFLIKNREFGIFIRHPTLNLRNVRFFKNFRNSEEFLRFWNIFRKPQFSHIYMINPTWTGKHYELW